MTTRPWVGKTVRVPTLSLATWDQARFRAARQRRGWTLAQLAAAAGLQTSAVRQYAAGNRSPGPAALVALATALEVPTTELAPFQDPPRLHELRWHRGLTVAQLASKVGRSTDYTSSILRGEAPITDRPRWAELLGVDEDLLRQSWEATVGDVRPS